MLEGRSSGTGQEAVANEGTFAGLQQGAAQLARYPAGGGGGGGVSPGPGGPANGKYGRRVELSIHREALVSWRDSQCPISCPALQESTLAWATTWKAGQGGRLQIYVPLIQNH